MDLENLTLEQTRKAIKEEWRCNLGDGMKAMLLGLVDRLELAESKLAAMESQCPVYFWKEIGETDWMECNKDWYLKCVDSPEHDTKLLYAQPVPADKPGYKAIKRTDLPSNANRDHMLNEAANRADYFFRQIDGSYKFPAPDGQVSQVIEMLLAAANMPADKPAVGISKMEKSAPSHSQQRAYKAHEWDGKGICKKCGVTIFGRRDACPSHESEQGGAV